MVTEILKKSLNITNKKLKESYKKTVKIIINRLNKAEKIKGRWIKLMKYCIQISIRKRMSMTTIPNNFGICSRD